MQKIFQFFLWKQCDVRETSVFIIHHIWSKIPDKVNKPCVSLSLSSFGKDSLNRQTIPQNELCDYLEWQMWRQIIPKCIGEACYARRSHGRSPLCRFHRHYHEVSSEREGESIPRGNLACVCATEGKSPVETINLTLWLLYRRIYHLIPPYRFSRFNGWLQPRRQNSRY